MIPKEEAKDENQNIFASQIWIYAPSKIHSSTEPLGRIFPHLGLLALLVIPSEVAKDENQNIFASQIWIYAPKKFTQAQSCLDEFFLGHKKTHKLRLWVLIFILRRKRDSNPR